MLRQSVIAAAVAVATITAAASIGSAQTQNGTHHRTNVHHAYIYEPVANPYYHDPYYYGPYGRTITARARQRRSPMLLGQQSAPPSR
jgi:hypothetical protein